MKRVSREAQERTGTLDLSNLYLSTLPGLSKVRHIEKLYLGTDPDETKRIQRQLPISNWEELSKLKHLKILLLYRTSCDNLAFIKSMPDLIALTIHSSPLWDISQLKNLKYLELLSLQDMDITSGVSVLKTVPSDFLFLKGSRVGDIPPSLYDGLSPDGINRVVKEYLAEKDTRSPENASPNTQRERDLKVLILGTGQVGKTRLTRAIMSLADEERTRSTHGIELHSLEAKSLNSDLSPGTLRIWDFGGQELYHDIHRLLLDEHALIILCWSDKSEDRDTHEIDGVFYPNQRLDYWVQLLKLYGIKLNKIMLVKCGDGEITDCKAITRLPPDIANEFSDNCHSFDFSNPTDIRAKFATTVKKAQGDTVVVAKSRIPLRKALADQRNEGVQKLNIAEVIPLLNPPFEEQKLKDALTQFHNLGYLIYLPDVLGDVVILDPKWLIDAIYALLDREKTYPDIQDHLGLIYPQRLRERYWKDAGLCEGQRRLALTYMEHVGQLIKLGSTDIQVEEDAQAPLESAEDRTAIYLVPNLLPDEPTLSAAKRWEALTEIDILESGEYHVFKYHNNLGFGGIYTYNNIISRLAKIGGHALTVWKNGVQFYESNSGYTVRLCLNFSSFTATTLAAYEPSLEVMIRHDKDENSTNQNNDLEGFLSWISNELINSDTELLIPSNTDVKEYHSAHFYRSNYTPKITLSPHEEAEVYISYKWGDETPEGLKYSSKVAAIDVLLQSAGFRVRRDLRDAPHMTHLPTFMRHLATDNRLYMILKQGYFSSENCMYEFLSFWDHQQQTQAKGLPKNLCVHLYDNAGITSIHGRLAVARYWYDYLLRLDDTSKPLNYKWGGFAQRFRSLLIRHLPYLDTYLERIATYNRSPELEYVLDDTAQWIKNHQKANSFDIKRLEPLMAALKSGIPD